MLASDWNEETLPPAGPIHRPVLLGEVVRALRPRPGSVLVDATVGAGGHAEALLDAVEGRGRVYGIDRDPRALAYATERLLHFGRQFVPVRGNHRDLVTLLNQAGCFAVDGIVADLGVSSLQLDDAERGFSFRADGPLDMRMDPESGQPAWRLLEELSEEEIGDIIRRYGEERQARRIARAIVRRRESEPFRTTRQLAELVAHVAGPRARARRIHPATRTFQALRIAVNDELSGLGAFVDDAVSLLRPGGRLAVLAFHSLEDRQVKNAMRALAQRCICPPGLPVCGCGRENLVKLVTHRPIRPTESEVEENPRSRSARLRVVERL